MSDPWSFRGTVDDFVELAKSEGSEYAHMLEVHPGRCWLLVSGTPTDRLRDRVEENRLVGVQITVASFDQLDEIVGGLMEEAESKGFRDGKADRWWRRVWRGLGAARTACTAAVHALTPGVMGVYGEESQERRGPQVARR